MSLKKMAVYLTLVAGFAAALTTFYFAHDGLPKALRAPTSLILAPVAIVDGLCFAAGIPGIYGRLVPVFAVNFVTIGVGWWVIARIMGLWKRRS